MKYLLLALLLVGCSTTHKIDKKQCEWGEMADQQHMMVLTERLKLYDGSYESYESCVVYEDFHKFQNEQLHKRIDQWMTNTINKWNAEAIKAMNEKYK